MFSVVLHLLVYSVTFAFCQWALTLTQHSYRLIKPQVSGIKIATVYR